VWAQPTFGYGRNWHVPNYSPRKTLALLGKRILFTDIDKKKWQSTSARKDERSGSKMMHHQTTLIERFQTDIMQILFTEWIENSIADIGREIAATDIFLPTLRNFFLKTLAGRQCFFTAEEVFLFWCCIKNLKCRSARVFCASSTDVWLWPKLHVPNYSPRKTLALLGKKILFTDIDKKKMTVDVGKERWTIRV